MHGISRPKSRKCDRQSAGIRPPHAQRQKLSFFKTLKSVLLCSFYNKDKVVVPPSEERSAKVYIHPFLCLCQCRFNAGLIILQEIERQHGIDFGYLEPTTSTLDSDYDDDISIISLGETQYPEIGINAQLPDATPCHLTDSLSSKYYTYGHSMLATFFLLCRISFLVSYPKQENDSSY